MSEMTFFFTNVFGLIVWGRGREDYSKIFRESKFVDKSLIRIVCKIKNVFVF